MSNNRVVVPEERVGDRESIGWRPRMRICNVGGWESWRFFPELTLSFERHYPRTAFVYVGWLCFCWKIELGETRIWR